MDRLMTEDSQTIGGMEDGHKCRTTTSHSSLTYLILIYVYISTRNNAL